MEVDDQACCSGGMAYGSEHRWTARHRTVIAKMEQQMNESDNVKVVIEELEHYLLGPESQRSTSDTLR